MDIRPNAIVFATDGPAGQISRIILNPVNDHVTHVVVDGPLEGPVLVRLSDIVSADADGVHVAFDTVALGRQEPFLEHHLAPARPQPINQDMSSYAYLTAASYSMDSTELQDITHERVPAGELAIQPGALVHATDGKVGEVENFLVDLTDGRMTHFVLRGGHFWGHHEVQVPVEAIDHIAEHDVYLTLNKAEINAMPTVKAR